MNGKGMMPIILIFLIGTGGIGASFAITKLIAKDKQPQPEFTTGFFAINESEIVFGKPAYYRIIVENYEGTETDYNLKVFFSGQEIYKQEINLNNSQTFNQTIKLNPNVTDYQELEFSLYKANQKYKTRVFQIYPVINYSIAGSLKVTPPSLQNGDMENDIAWKFDGKGLSGGNYTSSEWMSPERSYQIGVYKRAKNGDFGSIIQNVSNKEEGFASLSFDIKSTGASYYTQAIMNNEIVWENSSGYDWLRVTVPVFIKKSNQLEFKAIAKNDTNSSITAWLDNIKFVIYSPDTKKESIEREDLPYIKKKNGDALVFMFYSGESLELNVSNGNVSNGDATYTTSSKGNNITFLAENYEKIQPNVVNILYPIIEDVKDIKLKTGETFKLKDGYAVTLNQIDNQSLELSISRNNTTLRKIISKNSTVEYWKEIDDYEKEKVIRITPKKISQGDIILDIVQYGDMKRIIVGDKYGEFLVTNITENSITLKNNQSIKFGAGNVISLMGGKMNIKI
jgi:hypothetical protein